MVARNRVTISGTLGSAADEAWSVSLHYQEQGGGAVTEQGLLTLWAQQAATYLQGLIGGNGTLIDLAGGGTKANLVTVYAYGDTGPAIASASAPCTFQGNGSAFKPPQCAVAFSLITGVPGASRRGRIYWPAIGATIGATLRLANVQATADQAAALVEGLGAVAAFAEPMQPVVYSPTLDVNTPIIAVRVGNVVDTQRRRRDRLVEAYSTASL